MAKLSVSSLKQFYEHSMLYIIVTHLHKKTFPIASLPMWVPLPSTSEVILKETGKMIHAKTKQNKSTNHAYNRNILGMCSIFVMKKICSKVHNC